MLGGGFLQSCRQPAEPAEAQAEPSQGLAAVERSEMVELIGLLAHPNELNRARAHEQLLQYLVVDVDAPDYPDRLTLFHKFAPHACRADHEAQTLHILELFAAQEDITSILVVQCLRSPHASVRAAALELAHFSDNAVDEALLEFEPDAATLESYRIALKKLGTPEAAARLSRLGDR